MRRQFIIELESLRQLTLELAREHYSDCPAPEYVIRRLAADILEAMLYDPELTEELSDDLFYLAVRATKDIEFTLMAYLNTVCVPIEFHVLDTLGSVVITTF